MSDGRARASGLVPVFAPVKEAWQLGIYLDVMQMPVLHSISQIFALSNKNASDADEVVTLTRRAADELVLTSVIGLAAATDISVPYDTYIYATDASNTKRAVTSKKVGAEISEILWLGGDKRGSYTMLDAPTRAMLRLVGEDCDATPLQSDVLVGPPKVIPFESLSLTSSRSLVALEFYQKLQQSLG